MKGLVLVAAASVPTQMKGIRLVYPLLLGLMGPAYLWIKINLTSEIRTNLSLSLSLSQVKLIE